jgi:hypothetical protein
MRKINLSCLNNNYESIWTKPGKWAFVWVLKVSIFPLSTILIYDFGIVQTFGSLRFSFLYISKELFISLNYSKYIYKYLLSFRRDSLLFVTVTLFTYYFAVLRFNYFQRDNHEILLISCIHWFSFDSLQFIQYISVIVFIYIKLIRSAIDVIGQIRDRFWQHYSKI